MPPHTMPDPLALARLGWTFWRMALESQQIILMRLWGMSGLRPAHPTETTVMFTEKARAARDSAIAAGVAAMSGASPETIAAKALAPYARRTRSNVKRLSTTPRRRG